MATDKISQIWNVSRKDLLDLSLKNSLLNYRPTKRRGIQIVQESAKEVYRILVSDGKTMSFLPARDDINGEKGQIIEAPNRKSEPLIDSWLQTNLTEKALQSKLLATYHDSKTYIEERGVNILFLALGMLHWFESDNSERALQAPIILIPLSLERTDAREKFRIRFTDEEIEGNLSLSEKLKHDFGINYPNFPDSEDLDIDSYFGKVRRAIKGQAQWQLTRDDMVLGFFSFGKFLMYRDLDESRWPENLRPLDHPLIKALLRDRFKESKSILPDDAFVDDHYAPQQSYSVVDADSSQMAAILEVKDGRSIVVQGPPGTGKSQTITNLIAEALAQEKKVLFVAEKMAALEVVKRRLDTVGLGEACLELHSHNANKKLFLAELERVLELGKPVANVSQGDYDYITKLRDHLNSYSELLNTYVANTGYTPYMVIGELVQLRDRIKDAKLPFTANPIPSMATDSDWRRPQLDGWTSLIRNIQNHLLIMGVPAKHCFRGSQLLNVLPLDRDTIKDSITSCMHSIDRVQHLLNETAKLYHISIPKDLNEVNCYLTAFRRSLMAPNLEGININSNHWSGNIADIHCLLSEIRKFQQYHSDYDSILQQHAWNMDLKEVTIDLETYGRKWWRYFNTRFRRSRNLVRGLLKSPRGSNLENLMTIASTVVTTKTLYDNIAAKDLMGVGLFGTQWKKHLSSTSSLSIIADWLHEVHMDIIEGKLKDYSIKLISLNPPKQALKDSTVLLENETRSLTTSLSRLSDLLKHDEKGKVGLSSLAFSRQKNVLRLMFDNLDLLHDQVAYNHLIAKIRAEGLTWIQSCIYSWPSAAAHLTTVFLYLWFDAFLRRIYEERPLLKDITGESLKETIARFQEKDRQLLRLNQIRLALKHWEQIPRFNSEGNLGILFREIKKRRRHLPIRQLIQHAGRAIQAIKPVFMMSPMSIASFIPPGTLSFDLIIFDEASQVKPVDAFGAFARGRQVVVVGDSRQLPPTSFFENLVDEDEEFDENLRTSDMESILDLMCAQGAQPKMLRWHYRSRHHSLIAVSNKEFYDNKLVIFPCPNGLPSAVRFHHVSNAVYDRGRSRTNPIEAEVIAEAVLLHARTKPHLSLGVVAFSLSQMQCIIDKLEILRKKHTECESFFASHPHEPFFVKNLESVQGDERDVIFISIGFGKSDDTGYVSMNFGALNAAGGERRLNVLITRARIQCEVFTNLTHNDIDLTRSGSKGLATLKTYLKFAETGILDIPRPSGKDSDSPFEDAVADAIRTHGYTVDLQVGTGGFLIDLGIVDPSNPGQYILGIECDGAKYHSAKSARDRDRLRQEVLENLGWKIHRIWSSDWFSNPDRELRKVLEVLEDAKIMRRTDKEPVNLATSSTRSIKRQDSLTIDNFSPAVSPYRKATLTGFCLSAETFHIFPPSFFLTHIEQIVKVESPVHVDDVFQRIIETSSVNRVGNRIRDTLTSAVWHAIQLGKVQIKGDFLWHPIMEKPEIRDRSEFEQSEKKIERICDEEIYEAIIHVVKSSFGIDYEDVAPAACRLLGFSHVSQAMRDVSNRILNGAIRSGSVTYSNNKLICT